MFPSKIGFHSSILVPKITSTLIPTTRSVGGYGSHGYILTNNINKRERLFVTSTSGFVAIEVQITSASSNPFFVITGTNAFATPIEVKINNGEYLHIGVRGVVAGSGTLSVRSGSSTGAVLASITFSVTSGGGPRG